MSKIKSQLIDNQNHQYDDAQKIILKERELEEQAYYNWLKNNEK